MVKKMVRSRENEKMPFPLVLGSMLFQKQLQTSH